MATLYSGSLGTNGYPDGWKWYFTITSREDANNYYVDIKAYLQGTFEFPLDLMQKDIWWTINFDGSSYEIFRVYLSNGQYQNLQPNTKYGNTTVTKTYSKTSSSQSKSVSFSVFGSATEYTNMLGTGSSGAITFTIPSGYKAPSGFSISATASTYTTITVKANWTNGSKSSTATIKAGNDTKTISSSGGTATLSGLTANTKYTISGTLSDGNTTLNASTTKWTNIATPTISNIEVTTTTANIVAGANGNANPIYRYTINNGTWSANSSFTGLTANTEYTAQVKISNPDHSDKESSVVSKTFYTKAAKPNITNITVTPTTVTITASANGNANPRYLYRIDNGTWSTNNTFSNLNPNTKYTAYVKVSNTENPNGESEIASKEFTTQHAPLTGLTVNLVDSWYWYLKINCSYNYTGTITKYEFAIGDQEYRTVSSNLHERGTVNESNSGKLSYNTSYPCKVRLTDEYGRTYEASVTFKTLDERCLYVNGELREVKLIQSNGTIKYITPNLLSIIKSDGTVVNMNKIINNDNRTEH